MRYFKRSGEGYEAWGDAVYFIEVDDEDWVQRAIQLYPQGQLLLYDVEHTHDQYGGLADQRLDDLKQFTDYEITADDFEARWRIEEATNRAPH